MTNAITLRATARNLLPRNGYAKLRWLYWGLNAWLYKGDRYDCPVCERSYRVFNPFGADIAIARELQMISLGRRNASVCPGCISKERDRAIALYLAGRRCWFQQKPRVVLHIAPEEGLGRFLRRLPNVSYLSGDLCPNHSPAQAMRQVDITNMPFEAETFDLLICSHVLEHVEDDRQAMREVLRVLKVGGTAILQVPYSLDLRQTREDHTVTEPADRLRLFGQEDHVRLYGMDYAERLHAAGFTVTVSGTISLFGEETARRNGLALDESLFVCSKGPSDLDQVNRVKW